MAHVVSCLFVSSSDREIHNSEYSLKSESLDLPKIHWSWIIIIISFMAKFINRTTVFVYLFFRREYVGQIRWHHKQ